MWHGPLAQCLLAQSITWLQPCIPRHLERQAELSSQPLAVGNLASLACFKLPFQQLPQRDDT